MSKRVALWYLRRCFREGSLGDRYCDCQGAGWRWSMARIALTHEYGANRTRLRTLSSIPVIESAITGFGPGEVTRRRDISAAVGGTGVGLPVRFVSCFRWSWDTSFDMLSCILPRAFSWAVPLIGRSDRSAAFSSADGSGIPSGSASQGGLQHGRSEP